MKTSLLQKLIKFLPFLLFIMNTNTLRSQTNIIMTLNNATNVSASLMEFDIWIKNQGTTQEKLSGYTIGINHANVSPGLKNGGILIFSMVAGSRDPIFNTLDNNPSITYVNNQFKIKTINMPQALAVQMQYGVPYRIGRFRVKNTVNFATNYNPALVLSAMGGPSMLKCSATSYCNGSSNQMSFAVPNGLSLTTNTPGFTLNPPLPPTITIYENQPISCYGNNDGSAEAVPVGNPPFTFNVDGGPYNDTTGLFYGLTPGTHTICVKDVNGLTACGTISFIEPDPLAMTFTIDSMESCQQNDGAITANITGGTNLLQGYLTWWTNSAGDTLNNVLSNNFALSLTGLPSGLYNVSIEDDRGCFYNQTGLLPDAPPILVSSTIPPIVCHNGTTTINPSATGGVPYAPLTYQINGLAVASAYPAGTYTITATDAKGCTGTTSVTITNPAVITSSTNISACGSYQWPANNVTYSLNGTYTATLTNMQGCDSIASIVLTLIPNTTNGSNTISACIQYTWSVTGLTYTNSGTYVHTSVNSSGCTNIATLNLTINQNTTNGNATITACGSYLWNGVTYTASGMYTHTSLNANNCLNTATLTLTINQNTTNGNTTAVACDFYTWNGVTYFTSGIYTKTTLNAAGCVNTATLTLTVNVNPTTGGTIGFNESACGPSFDPAPMTTVIPPGGASGPLQYLWLSSLDGGLTFTILYGATNASYDPGIITQTTWYRRCARVVGCSSYSSESNWIMKQVLTCKNENPNALLVPDPARVISGVSIYPNPLTSFDHNISLDFYMQQQSEIELAVYSLEGKLLKKQRIYTGEGHQQVDLEVPLLHAGSYTFVVTCEDIKETYLLMVR